MVCSPLSPACTCIVVDTPPGLQLGAGVLCWLLELWHACGGCRHINLDFVTGSLILDEVFSSAHKVEDGDPESDWSAILMSLHWAL